MSVNPDHEKSFERPLSEEEQKLLEFVRTGVYERINIVFQNQEMKALELVQSHSTKRKVVEILSDASYQDIVVKTHEGKIASVKNTIKLKF